jgi:hypothetical protein
VKLWRISWCSLGILGAFGYFCMVFSLSKVILQSFVYFCFTLFYLKNPKQSILLRIICSSIVIGLCDLFLLVFAKYFVGPLKELTFLPHCVERVYRFVGCQSLEEELQRLHFALHNFLFNFQPSIYLFSACIIT